MGKLVTGVAAAAAALYTLKKAFDLSSELKNFARDAVETTQKFEQVFSSIVESAHETSKALQEAFKLASNTSQELLGNTGDLLVGFGFIEEKALELSDKIVRLALDLRSFKNIQMDATEVTQLMISAMSGNMRAIRSLGVVLRLEDTDLKRLIRTYEEKLGYDKKQAVALAVLDEAYNQSYKSVGDFARTQEQLANQERILEETMIKVKTQLGNALIPAFLEGVGAANELAEKIADDLTPAVEGFGKTMGATIKFLAEWNRLASQESPWAADMFKSAQEEAIQAINDLRLSYSEYMDLLNKKPSVDPPPIKFQ